MFPLPGGNFQLSQDVLPAVKIHKQVGRDAWTLLKLAEYRAAGVDQQRLVDVHPGHDLLRRACAYTPRDVASAGTMSRLA